MSLTLSPWLRGAWPSGVRSQELHTIGDTGHMCLLQRMGLFFPLKEAHFYPYSLRVRQLVAHRVGC
jgi:hypothetical protein